MGKNESIHILNMMEEVRKLSFRFSVHEERMQSQQKRIETLKQDVQEAATLGQDYKTKSKDLSQKIKEMKTVTNS